MKLTIYDRCRWKDMTVILVEDNLDEKTAMDLADIAHKERFPVHLESQYCIKFIPPPEEK